MEVQERILDTAFGLFRQYGTRSITMDDIATRMGISKKTLYAHFVDKDDMVVHSIRRYLEIMQEEDRLARERSANAIEELFETMNMMDVKLRNMNPVIMLDLQKFHSKAFTVFQEYRNNSLHTIIRGNLERGIAEGLYRKDLDVNILTQFRIASAMLCFQPEAFPMDGYEMSRVQRVLLEHFLYGVAAEEGFRLIEKYKQQQTK
ncbi:TetR/AcrR family transcriptional regulator [Chitinophaga agrisoli]|uniref:TetR/AcrR family transcriptional regulator n=1 Tax=Chitinophaga agrisoli TaxID=2607653 RepID=A0A5B2W3V4_9BACT|nr:TetR/AcrR family transcriptional regulator [Chitinophaga agrisoli]KAA2245538.1 TetR/AcrR family transcriptional regulator [Chitinophaga agrisoli]